MTSGQFALIAKTFFLCGCFLFAAGCERRVSFAADADQIEKAFSLTTQSPQAEAGAFKTAETPALAKTLVVALRSSDFATASQALHTLNYRGGGLSFDQFNSIRQAFGDVSGELAKRAAKGDEQAKELLNKMSPG